MTKVQGVVSSALVFWACACSSADGGGTQRALPASGSGAGGSSAAHASGSGGANGVANAGAGSFGNAQPGAQTTTPMSSGIDNSDVCEVVHLTTNPQVPDMMIVLDRSGSMKEGKRWDPSVSAVRRVTMELGSQINFGLTLFPDPADVSAADIFNCALAPDPQMCLNMLPGACSPGKIVVPIAAQSAAMIGQVLDMTQPSGGTPTSETLQAVLDSFGSAASEPDAVIHPKYVLLVTDGQPTCPNGNGKDTTPPDIDASNKVIEALAANGVRTYVIGYDTTGAGNEMLAAVLDGFAMRGGTGDTMHHPVEDEQSLLTVLQSIVGSIAGCTFALDQAPPRADFVLVRLDGTQLNLGEGWQLMDDHTVELIGAACERLKDGSGHMVDAEVQCQPVGPI